MNYLYTTIPVGWCCAHNELRILLSLLLGITHRFPVIYVGSDVLFCHRRVIPIVLLLLLLFYSFFFCTDFPSIVMLYFYVDVTAVKAETQGLPAAVGELIMFVLSLDRVKKYKFIISTCLHKTCNT